MKKKEAIFLINSLQSGGAERVVLTQAEELLDQGISVTLLLVQNKIQYIPDPRIRIIPLTKKEEPRFFSRLFSLPFLASRIDKILHKMYSSREVVLLSAHLLYCYILASFTKYRNHFLYVLHTPHYWMPYGDRRFFKKALQILYNRRKIICVSKGVQMELLKRYHVKPEHIDTIYNPLNFKKIDMQKEENLEQIPTKPYILFCGRLNKAKRIDRLIDAYALGGFHQKYNLVLVGIGEREQDLKNQAASLGLEKDILFTGWSDHVYSFMAHASLFVISSDYEAFPMALCEALYCNCPVVSVHCRYGPSEILTGKLRKYLAKPTPMDLAEKMQRALDSYPDHLKDYCKELTSSKNVAQYLKDFSDWSTNE